MNLDSNRRRLRDEMEHHIDELRAQLESQGMTPEAARREASRRFGDPERFAEEAAQTVSRPGVAGVLESLRLDVRFALRRMRRDPLMTLLTLATLVVGVSATAIVFSVVHAVVLRPLPFSEPDRLVHVTQTSPQGRFYSVSEPNFVDFRRRQSSFEEMAAMGFQNPILSGLGDPESIEGRKVSATFFPLLGIQPMLGRGFTEEEDRFGGANDVVLLSEGAWRRRFGADRALVGRTITLDGEDRRVVGIVPSDRAWPGVEVWAPLAPNPDVYRDDQRLAAIARLAPGVDLEEARRDMSAIAADLSVEYPESNDGWGAAVESARDWLVGERLTRLGALLMGAVALFLLMACASVSNLLIARATARTREMSVRSALGAGRGRLLGQLAVEGTVLAVVGGGIALAIAWRGVDLIRRVGPDDIARLGDATVSGPVLAVALGAAVVTVLVAGIAPAALLSRGDLFGVLRNAATARTDLGARLRDGLVVAQFALAVTVVSGAGLLARSFVELQEVELGFDAGGTIRFSVRLPDDRFDQRARAEYIDRLAAELSAVPGIAAVGGTTVAPFSQMRPSNFVARSDREPDRQQDFLPVSWRAVTPGFFEASGIPLIAGRTFGLQDRPEPDERVANPPVIIDRALAELLWPEEENPVGRLLTWFLPGGQQCEVVGVVGIARDERIDVEPRPRIYRPFLYSAWDQPAVIVSTEGDPAASVSAVRSAVLRVDPTVPAIEPTPVTADVRESVAWPRFSMQVLSIFGLVALVLAAMGIYGVTAFSVAQRRQEIGVRVALGAEPGRVRWLVVRRAIRLAVVGIAGGLAASFLLTRFLESLLYGIRATDPATFVLVPTVLAGVALAATWLPARRAVRLDPREALRSD
jgi:predicted permease